MLTKLTPYLNLIVLLAMGVCYTEALKWILNTGSNLTRAYEPLSQLGKMMLTSTSSIIACLAIFTFNRYLVRQNVFALGIASGVTAFVWFYVIKADGMSVLGLLISVALTPYSLIALVAFVGFPILLGWFGRKTPGMTGLKYFSNNVNH